MERSAFRIQRVVVRESAKELVGVVDLELLGAKADSICTAQVEVKHPLGAEYDPDFLRVGPIELGDTNGGSVPLPQHDAFADIVRSWMSGVLETSIFGFGASGVMPLDGRIFERPMVYVLSPHMTAVA